MESCTTRVERHSNGRKIYRKSGPRVPLFATSRSVYGPLATFQAQPRQSMSQNRDRRPLYKKAAQTLPLCPKRDSEKEHTEEKLSPLYLRHLYAIAHLETLVEDRPEAICLRDPKKPRVGRFASQLLFLPSPPTRREQRTRTRRHQRDPDSVAPSKPSFSGAGLRKGGELQCGAKRRRPPCTKRIRTVALHKGPHRSAKRVCYDELL